MSKVWVSVVAEVEMDTDWFRSDPTSDQELRAAARDLICQAIHQSWDQGARFDEGGHFAIYAPMSFPLRRIGEADGG